LKVLVVSMKYDYGEPARGLSNFDYYFEKPISRLVDSVISYDFMSVFHEVGRDRMNQDLLDTIRREQPDVTIFVPFTDQFIPEVVDAINKHTVTVGYFFDDTWRIQYSRFWAGHFRFATTSDVNGVKRWRDAGCSNFIYSPFACSLEIYRQKHAPKIYDITFVGQYHPYRAWCLRRLQRAGMNVKAWGYGWPAGRLDLEGVVDVFNRSKINLNLSNNDSWDLRYMVSCSRPLMETMRIVRRTLRAATHADVKTREMVKARHFEINACGGFQLSYFVEGLERHYQIGNEIVVYGDVDDIVDKARYYLKYADERESIARCGYERTIRDHTMEKRFADLFYAIGIKTCRKN
jgi:spore maturation protein CgeB